MKSKYSTSDIAQEAKRAFSVFNTEATRLVTVEGIQKVLMDVGESMSPNEITDIIREFDADQDDALTLQEFTAIIKESNKP